MKISIITCSYNSANTIRRAIKSVQNQNYKNIEHIIMDGSSQDKTIEIIKKFKKKNLFFFSSKDNGFYYALNKATTLSNGEIVGILHSDDFFHNNKILSDIAKIFKNTNADIVYGDLMYVKKNFPFKPVRFWKSEDFEIKKIFSGWMPPHPTVFIKKKILNKIGIYNTKYRIAADYDFLIRAFKLKNIKIVYIPKIITNMRVGGMSNASIKNLIIKSSEDFRIIKKNKIGGIGVLLNKNFSKLKQFFYIKN